MQSLSFGTVPLISARKFHNGLKGFVQVPLERIREGHAITLNNDGDGGAGLAYYQPSQFALDTHVTELRPKENMSQKAMLFVAAVLSKQHKVFGHGRSINKKRLKTIRIMLPINEKGNPAWNVMSEYIKKYNLILLKRYRDYLD